MNHGRSARCADGAELPRLYRHRRLGVQPAPSSGTSTKRRHCRSAAMSSAPRTIKAQQGDRGDERFRQRLLERVHRRTDGTSRSSSAWRCLMAMSSKRKAPGAKPELHGHVWDEDLAEYNNPLPRWWIGLFYLTIVFCGGLSGDVSGLRQLRRRVCMDVERSIQDRERSWPKSIRPDVQPISGARAWRSSPRMPKRARSDSGCF